MKIPTKISVDVDYHIDDLGSIVFDAETMTKAFNQKLKELTSPKPEYKNSVTHTAFLRWFLSDDAERKSMIDSVRKDLVSYGSAYISVDMLYQRAAYIPQQICVDYNGTEEYNPKDVKLIVITQ